VVKLTQLCFNFYGSSISPLLTGVHFQQAQAIITAATIEIVYPIVEKLFIYCIRLISRSKSTRTPVLYVPDSLYLHVTPVTGAQEFLDKLAHGSTS